MQERGGRWGGGERERKKGCLFAFFTRNELAQIRSTCSSGGVQDLPAPTSGPPHALEGSILSIKFYNVVFSKIDKRRKNGSDQQMTHDSLPCLADQERKLVEHFCTLVDRVVYLRPRRHLHTLDY